MHLFHLGQEKPQNQTAYGYRIKATKSNFPALKTLSMYKVGMQKGAAREPHWHANADELGYVLQGEVVVSVFGNENARERYLVSKGEAFFIPSGAFHSLEPISEEPCELVLCFSNEEPEDFALSTSFGMFSNAVLGNTWSVPASDFDFLKRPASEVFIAKLDKPSAVPEALHYASPSQYPLEASAPLIANEGGTAKVARKDVWPIVKGQALYSLFLTGIGMREPHWHPETSELGYVAEGKGRMSIQSPSGQVDTYIMEKGDIYFVPKAYPHHIENLNSTPLHLLIFFDQAMPQDIGFSGGIKSFSNEILTSVLNAPAGFFDKLPTFYEDRFIVTKTNPVDP